MFKVSVEGSFLYPLSCWDKHFFRSMYPVSWFRAACSHTLENASLDSGFIDDNSALHVPFCDLSTLLHYNLRVTKMLHLLAKEIPHPDA